MFAQHLRAEAGRELRVSGLAWSTYSDSQASLCYSVKPCLAPPAPPPHTHKEKERRKEDTGTFHTNWRVNEARHEGQGF